MSKGLDEFVLDFLNESLGQGRPYPEIPCVRGRHLTTQQHDIIFQVIDNLKKPDLIDGVLNPSKFWSMGISGPRRCGKTTLVANLIPLVEDKIKFYEPDKADPTGKKMVYKNMNFLLTSMTKGKVEDLYWEPLMKHSANLGLGFKSNVSGGFIKTARGNRIVFKGLGDIVSSAGGLGDKYVMVFVDEVQQIVEDILLRFIHKIIKPATSDYGGTTCLLGTLPEIPSGYWHEVVMNKIDGLPFHFLDYKKNIFISQSAREAMIQDELRQAGLKKGKETAQFRREWYGEFIWDATSIVFDYKTERNHYTEVKIPPEKRNYVIGVDIGFDDADAFAVMCYGPDSEEVYLLEEFVREKQDVSSCCQKIRELCDQYNDPIVIVDSGSIGKKVMAEMIKRYDVNAVAADKSINEKGGWIHAMRHHLHGGKLKIRQESYAVHEKQRTEFNDTQDGWKRGGYHPNLLDAILYSFKYIYNTLHMFKKYDPKPKPKPKGSAEDRRLARYAELNDEPKPARRLGGDTERRLEGNIIRTFNQLNDL